MYNIELYNENRQVSFYDEPNVCPICHRHIVAEAITAFSNSNENCQEVLFHCNNRECSHIFIATYENVYSDKNTSKHMITKMTPQKVKPLDVNQDIQSISPSFKKIYTQALEAEVMGLDEISGVGFRKALEFLIKDYCIKNNSGEEESIKSRPLMQVINSHMTEASKVKACATKAIWIGNDETHYVRKWKDKDIKDLKLLIQLTLHHIESELLTAQFEADMVK